MPPANEMTPAPASRVRPRRRSSSSAMLCACRDSKAVQSMAGRAARAPASVGQSPVSHQSANRRARAASRRPERTDPVYSRVMAAGEAPIKQAVKWIEDRLADDPHADRLRLVDEASRRFDLTPLDADF